MDVRRKIQTVILSLILSILMMFEIILVCILMAPGMYNDSNFNDAWGRWNINPTPATEKAMKNALMWRKIEVILVDSVFWGITVLNTVLLFKVGKAVWIRAKKCHLSSCQ